MHITHLDTNLSQAPLLPQFDCTILLPVADALNYLPKLMYTDTKKRTVFLYGHFNKTNITSGTEFNLIGSFDIAARNSKST